MEHILAVIKPKAEVIEIVTANKKRVRVDSIRNSGQRNPQYYNRLGFGLSFLLVKRF